MQLFSGAASRMGPAYQRISCLSPRLEAYGTDFNCARRDVLCGIRAASNRRLL